MATPRMTDSATGLPACVRVLIVEDNEDQAEWLARALQSRTEVVLYAVEFARTMAAAEQRLAVDGIDAVLLDLTLPDSSDMESVRRIRAAGPSVALIVVTAYPEKRDRALEAGAEAFVSKGAPIADLSEAILYQVIERRGAEKTHTLEDALRQLGFLAAKLLE